jgi:GT2 family glycosyltransferase/glycosyltransferase involved in cell wall biosynthesis
MFRRLAALYQIYERQRLDIVRTDAPILDRSNSRIGNIDRIRLHGGRLQVTGWVLADRVRLALDGAEAETVPILPRPDVASDLGQPENVGFELAIPAWLNALNHDQAPELSVSIGTDAATESSLRLPLLVPRRSLVRLKLAFLRDLGLSVPAILGWYLTGNPVWRARIKSRLRMEHVAQSGPLQSALMRPFLTEPDCRTPPQITIVLPVFNAFELLAECLNRVDSHTDLPWRLIVIEDASTDPRVRPFLHAWANGRTNVVVLENPQNLGFIGSVNRGLAAAMADEGTDGGPDEGQDGGPDGGPVVLLNSDALVPEGWAGRLVAPFADARDVASVTPMSSDAELLSVPVICARTVLRPGQAEVMDRVARRFAPGVEVAMMPTAVGFCMAMARAWLRRVPAFDTAFGRGYGEEVDWCQRTAALGGRHLGLPGLFVEHRGGESFGNAEKQALIQRNNEVISRRYPEFNQRVQDFIATDPLRTARLALGLAWAGSLDPELAMPVYLAHAMGGGADLWLEDAIAEDLTVGRPSVILRVGMAHRWQVELVTPHGRTLGQTDDPELLRALMAVLPRRRLVFSCGVGDPDPVALPRILLSLMTEGDEARMLFHDYLALSPSYTLLNADGAYRGPVVAPRADRAHRTRRPDGSEVTLEAWQAAWKALAERSDLVVFSDDGAGQVAAVWPDLQARIRIVPHRLRHDVPRLSAPPPDAPIVLGVLGGIGLQKGAAVLSDLARRLKNLGPGAPRLALIGKIDPTYALPASVPVHGTYAIEDIPALAARYGVTHWLIPSIWPETFCYTAHEALATGLPVLAFGLGAQGTAVRRAPNGIEIPFDPDADLAGRILEYLQRLQGSELAAAK